MSDDLGTILKSIRNTQANILSRLEKIEQSQQEQGTNELVVPGGWGYTSPTSPASKRVLIRRGYAWTFDVRFEDTIGHTWEDFQPELPISAFSDAYYYRPVVLWMDLYYFSPYDGFDVWEADTDFETYEECASYMAHEIWDRVVRLNLTGRPVFPFCSIAVRNDGTTGSTNQYLPVTLTDRTQSSFINRDLRPWFDIAWWK